MMKLRTGTVLGIVAAAGVGVSASAGSIYSDASAFASGTVDHVDFDLNIAANQGQYGSSALGGGFPGLPGGGPSDVDATTFAGSSTLTVFGVQDPTDEMTISAMNTAGAAGDTFFVLDDTSDKNDVDSIPGNDDANSPPYVSFYGKNTSLVLDFNPGTSAFGFTSYDLLEGDIVVEWLDGSTTLASTTLSQGDFIGFAKWGAMIDRVTITTKTNQGVAITNLQSAVAVPTPAGAALGLPMLALAALFNRRRRSL